MAQAVEDKIEAAYRLGDLFAKRRRLMDDWATFCAMPVRHAVVEMFQGTAATT